jgi:hypothetical protein
MTDEQAPNESILARGVLADLRPQDFGRGNPSNVSNPLVEPLWAGLRVLAAIDAEGVAIVDEDGDPIDGFDAIIEALSGSSTGSELVIDGIITKQATRTSVSVVAWSDEPPFSMASMVGLRRNRATESIKLKETAYADATFDPADSIALVVTDLLWLDETSLLDIPLMERRRLWKACWSVRHGPDRCVRPAADPALGQLVARPGLPGPDVQGGQQSLPAWPPQPRMGHRRDATPLRVVRLASCRRPP